MELHKIESAINHKLKKIQGLSELKPNVEIHAHSKIHEDTGALIVSGGTGRISVLASKSFELTVEAPYNRRRLILLNGNTKLVTFDIGLKVAGDRHFSDVRTTSIMAEALDQISRTAYTAILQELDKVESEANRKIK